MSSWVIGWGDVSCWMLPGSFCGHPHAWSPLLPLRLVIEQHFPDIVREPWEEAFEFPQRVTERSDREKLFWYSFFCAGFLLVFFNHYKPDPLLGHKLLMFLIKRKSHSFWDLFFFSELATITPEKESVPVGIYFDWRMHQTVQYLFSSVKVITLKPPYFVGIATSFIYLFIYFTETDQKSSSHL